MNPIRRTLLGLVLCAASAATSAQSYPNRPIKYVIPFAAGGVSDVMGRRFARDLATELGQPVVVENKVGATGTIALAQLAASPPDGYLLMQFSNTTSVAHLAMNKPFEIDKVMTTLGNFNSSVPMMIVNPKVLDVKSLPEFIKHVQAHPGVDYTSSGAGSPGNLMIEAMANARKLKVTHVPYNGESPALRDVLAGRVGMIVTSGVTAKPFIESGALRVIASVSTSRSLFAPNVPTTTEQGMPDVRNDTLSGVVAPPGLPQPIAEKLRAAIRKVTLSEEFKQFLAERGNINHYIDGPEFRTAIMDDYQRWKEIIRQSGMELK